MPIDPGGNHSLPPGTIVQTGDKVLPSQHNPAMEDISATLSKTLIRDGRAPMTGPLRMGGYPIRNVQAGEGSNDAATVGQTVPIGTILAYALPTPPAGWIFCYGQALTSGQYPLLRQALLDAGSPYGTDGSGNPRVLDARDVTLVGRGNMGGTTRGLLSKFASTVLGAVFGTQEHTLTVAQMPAHNHSGTALSAGAHRHGVGAVFNGSGISSNGGYITSSTSGVFTSTDGAHTHNLSINNNGGGQAHPNVQPTTVVNYIIRAGY